MKKPCVFLCHSSVDKTFVSDLADRLIATDIDVWFDQLEIKIGDSIHQRINEGLKKSDFFVIVLSRASVESKWVQKELSSAASLEDLQDNKGVFVLPLLLEECDVPPLLLDRRYANFKDDPDSAFDELVDAIAHHFAERHPDVDVSRIRPPSPQHQLAQYIIENPQALSQLAPRVFEGLVAETMQKHGFDASLTAASTHGGQDIIASRPHPLGTAPDRLIIDCKRRTSPVGVGDVEKLAGALSVMHGPRRGMIVTTSRFTRQAENTALLAGIDLIDGETFLQWLTSGST